MEIKQRRNILQQLAQTPGDTVQEALDKEAEKIAEVLQDDTLYEQIEAQMELLDTIAYRVSDKAIEIITSLLRRLETLELTYLDVSGFPPEARREYQNNNTLVVKTLETLEHIRYHQPAPCLDIFFQYSVHMNETLSKQAKHGIEALAGFDLDIFYGDGKNWPGLGWEPQEKVLEKINSFTETEQYTFFLGIIVACGKILSPILEGTTWNYKSVAIRSGPVPALQSIKDIRGQALTILKNLYALADTVEQKKIVINTMHTATRAPYSGGYNDDVRAMIMQDTVTILEFMKAVVGNEDLQIMQKIEHDAYYLCRRAIDEHVKDLALEVKYILDNHAEYQIFKILIGFEGIFSEWYSDKPEAMHQDYNYEKALREQKAQEFAASITEDNYQTWKERILRYASIRSDDLATFPYFGKFLENLGKIAPSLAVRLLVEESQQLEGFMVPIVCGAWETSYRNEVHSIITEWIAENRYLFVLARVFQFTEGVDEELLKKIYASAKSRQDSDTLRQIISTVTAQYESGNQHLIKDLFLPALEDLTSQKNADWIVNVWFRKQLGDILSAMDSSAYQMILSNLLWLGKIDYHAEEILCEIAKNAPELVIQFFCDRIVIKRAGDMTENYEAFPYSFHALAEPLSKIPDQAVDTVLGIYDENYGMFIYQGAQFLKNIFPDFPKPFEHKLIQLAQTGDEKNLLFVMAVLRNYEGQEFLHEVCKELVKVLPDSESLLSKIYIILLSTGVVSGAYGFVEAYQSKIKEVQSWLSDPNEKIQKFAQNYISGLEKRIEAEKQRADEDIMLRKHRYGADDEE